MTNPFVKKLRNLMDLAPREIDLLVKATANPCRFAAKQHMICEGDRPGPVFVILEGWACRYKILPSGTRQIMAFLLPGDVCDLHVKILTQMDHSLQTITDARIALIPGEAMEAMMYTHPRIASAMYKSQLIDEGTQRSWIVSIGRRRSLERVAHLLCELYLRSVETDGSSAHVALPISQIMLADAIGMTAVHVNRMIRSLRLTGAVTLTRGQLTVLDPFKLVQIAGLNENYLHRRRDPWNQNFDS